MNQTKSTGFIIQARISSTRFSSKIILPFWNEKSILDLLIEKLKKEFQGIPIILATSLNKENDILEEIALKQDVLVYRGSETDVLSRFIEAARKFDINNIIRVCSDNPFLDVRELDRLINFVKTKDFDYVSFKIEDTPSIKTHFGFWTEFVTLQTLEKIEKITTSPIYHEHVTNFIYENPDKFSIFLLDPNEKVRGRKDIRMTLDTKQDFDLLSEIYKILVSRYRNIGIDETIDFLDKNPKYKISMMKQIKLNEK